MKGPGFAIGDAYRFASEHGLEAESREVRSMRVHPGIKKRHVPRKGAFVELFEGRGLMDEFVPLYWPARHTDHGKSRRQQYLDLKTQNEALLRGEGVDEDILDEVPDAEVELKLDRGPDRALGQLARYMGWVKIHLAGDHEVRGVVVARSIDERLRYAACVMPNVALLEYEVEFRLHDAGSIPVQPNKALQPPAAEKA
jgi:hypothetical protein